MDRGGKETGKKEGIIRDNHLILLNIMFIIILWGKKLSQPLNSQILLAS